MIRLNRIWACLIAACLLITVFGLCGATQGFAMSVALAEEGRELLDIQMSARPAEMVEPGDTMLTFTIENTSQVDAHNVYLSSSDGLLSEPFGRIAAGESQSFNRQHTVTQDELDSGEIIYIISHDDPFDEEGKVNYTVHTQIHRSDVQPQAEFTRQFSSRWAEPGSTLIVTYRIRNTGNVALTNLRVQDTLGDFTGRVDRLEAGDSRTLISRVTITEESISSAVLDYSVDGGGETLHTCALTDETIRIADSRLEAKLSASYSAFSRSTADVVLLMYNTGNVDLRNVRITDELYGGTIADSIVVPANAEPVEIAHVYPVRENLDFCWRITGESESGKAFDVTTNTVSLQPQEPGRPAMLTIAADTSTPRIRRSGDIDINIEITNSGSVNAQDVLLSEANLGPLRNFKIIPAGETTRRSFSFHVNENTDFNFSLRYIGTDGLEYTADCVPVHIEIAPDGVLPEGAKPAFIEFTGKSIKIGGSTTFAVLLIAGCVVLLILVIMLLIASRRVRIQRQLRIAAEKQRRKEEMSKTNRFTPVRAPKNKSKGRN